MPYDFDRILDRRRSESSKWHAYDPDVLPLWVADMDFAAPEPVIAALRARVDHGVFGYGLESPAFAELIAERLHRLYNWQVSPEAVVLLPGVIAGFNLACRAVTTPGDGVLLQTPVYPPILRAPGNAGLSREAMSLTRHLDGRYGIDLDAFKAAITTRTRIFLLCNPHNPVGRVFQRQELARMAEICLQHQLVICADEIHGDLVFNGHQHLPIASLAPEIAQQTITLMAPSKTFNIPGLKCAAAIIPNRALREQFKAARVDLVPRMVNVLAYTAALAAYRDGQAWLDAVLQYLEANRDVVHDYVNRHLPGITMAKPEGTFLAWLDCRQAGIAADNPYDFFLHHARVALNDGLSFGKDGAGFVRLNFGCPRALLLQALESMKTALERL